MKLSQIISYLGKSRAAPYLKLPNNCEIDEPDITEAFSDSRCVMPGSLFFCITGEVADGHKFAAAAQKSGAVALLAEHYVEDCSLPQIIVGSTREWMGKLSAEIYGNPSEKLKMFAVTGTNGKTTTTWIIRNLLDSLSMKCGIIGTIIQNDGLNEWDAERTTPESCDVQRLLARMVKNGCRACVMETSSHGLFLKRLDGCKFDVMSFTNLNPEHLDFHNDMESYFDAKKLLFRFHSKESSKIVANADAPYGRRVLDEYPRAVSFGFGDAQISAKSLNLSLEGSSFDLYVRGKNLGEIYSPLVGNFNVQNTLAAIAAVYESGIDVSILKSAVAKTPQVPGRLEKHFVPQCGNPRSACCVIDFAHTPEALKNVLSTVREFCKGKLVSAFGHGGGRYQANRPALGGIAASIADKVIVTMDNPRHENPADIARQIARGALEANPNIDLKIILNRNEAIKTALDELQEGDVLVLSGKGPEKYLTVGNEKIEYSDAGEVEKIIRTGTYLPIPSKLVLDSREVAAIRGCGFVALVGEKTDGHLYIEKAIEDGACFIVGKPDKKPQNFPAHIPYISLDDTEKELARLARRHIKRVAPKEIIAITGSVGKTTTREAAKLILEKKYRVHTAERSFNTLIGCAVSILSMPLETEILLLEFGANKPNEILELTQFFAPTFSVITEVAPVHLEGFKTIEGVLSGKMEITRSEKLKKFLYNSDNKLLKNAAANVSAKKISVGRADGSSFKITECENYSVPLRWSLEHGGKKINLSSELWGKHLVLIMSIASAIGVELGVDAEKIAEALAEYKALPGRGRIINKNGKIIIDDAYNANPTSMRASLETFIALDKQNKLAILGDMRELGENEAEFHRAFFSLIEKIDNVILVGDIWQKVLPLPRNCVHVANWEDAGSILRGKNWDALFVKGSNSHKLQKLVTVAEERF